MVTLYFEGLTEDHAKAVSTKGDTILYNLAQLNGEFWAKFQKQLSEGNKASTIFALHSYVCMVTMFLDDRESSMVLYDFHKTKDDIHQFARTFGDLDLAVQIVNAYQDTMNDTDYGFPDIELVRGTPPKIS